MAAHDPIEAAIDASKAERERFVLLSRPGNNPMKVVIEHDDRDELMIESTDDECWRWVERQALRAAIAAYLRARFDGEGLEPRDRILIRRLAAEIERGEL